MLGAQKNEPAENNKEDNIGDRRYSKAGRSDLGTRQGRYGSRNHSDCDYRILKNVKQDSKTTEDNRKKGRDRKDRKDDGNNGQNCDIPQYRVRCKRAENGER